MIDRSALFIASTIKKANPEQTASIEVMKYALVIYLNNFFIISESVIIGILSHKLSDTVTVLVALALLRSFSGGRHASSTLKCNLISVLICTVIPHVPKPDGFSVHLLTIASLLVISGFAPSYSGYTHKVILQYRIQMKIISIIIVSLNFFIQSWVIGLCFLVQALSTINFARKEVH
jgi:accessory gene regulator B